MSNRSSRAKFLAIGVFAASALVFVTPVFAQSTGAIQGTVTDATGAVVPNAAVIVKDPDHGIDRALTTDKAGIYYVPSLPVGTYSVQVRAPGLAPTEAKGLVLDVGLTVTRISSLRSRTQIRWLRWRRPRLS